MEDRELAWEINLAGGADRMFVSDPFESALYVGDGSYVNFASMGLKKLDLDTGREIAKVRLGNQVRALAFPEEAAELFAATEKKLYRLNRQTLEILDRWSGVLPSACHALSWHEGQLIGFNWNSVGVFIPKTSRSLKKRVAPLDVQVSQSKVLIWTGSGLHRFDPVSCALNSILKVRTCSRRALFVADQLWLHSPCDQPQYVTLEEFRSFGLCDIGLAKEVSPLSVPLGLPTGSVVGSAAVCEKAQRLLVIAVSWDLNRSRWRPHSLHSYNLPQMSEIGRVDLDAQALSIVVFPDKKQMALCKEVESRTVIRGVRLDDSLEMENWRSRSMLEFRVGWSRLTSRLASTFE